MKNGVTTTRSRAARALVAARDADKSWPGKFLDRVFPSRIARELEAAEAHIRSGRFQRSLSALAGASSVLAGAEVAYEHYRGSYGQQIMYTPPVLGAAMTIAGIWGAFSKRAAQTVLRWTSAITLLDGLVGFIFHIRGIARKPGGWRLPITNIIMGPPIFAPLLFGVSAYLGIIASFLRPEESPLFEKTKARIVLLPRKEIEARHPWTMELREGRFQKHLAVATAVGTFCTGAEALYSHYKNNFRYLAQWTPVIVSPLLIGSAVATLRSPKAARTWLPAMSAIAIVNGGVGFFYHARGVLRRPGGMKKPLYNVVYGPPIFAPLLFAACGTIGLLASLMRRERS
jgi:hypothetical protein